MKSPIQNEEELLADEQMELKKSIHASPSHLPQSSVITLMDPENSLIMGDEHPSTISEKDSK